MNQGIMIRCLLGLVVPELWSRKSMYVFIEVCITWIRWVDALFDKNNFLKLGQPEG